MVAANIKKHPRIYWPPSRLIIVQSISQKLQYYYYKHVDTFKFLVAWGASGRKFESSRPDQLIKHLVRSESFQISGVLAVR